MMLSLFVVAACIITNVSSLGSEVVVLRAVRGRDARLPCGQGKVFLDGPNSYVLWLKNDIDFLYRFPNEDTGKRPLSNDHVFGTSCEAGICHDDTSLHLKRVSEQDSGIYRCRVHYQASPAIDYVIDIRLVNCPGTPKIFNEAGEEITKGYVGPLSLGSDLALKCEVEDSLPDTVVYWRRNGVLVERAHAARPGVQRADVRVRNTTRADLDAHYECIAQNADVTDPLIASVVIKMYLPPLSVEIRLNNNMDFEAGQPRVVDCVVVGSVPPPSITWHLGDTLLRSTVHKELHDGNYTVSSLTLAASLRDSKRELVCRAHNSYLPTVYEDKVTLNVGYRPICLNAREMIIGSVEKDAETMTCVVESSPAPKQFSWTFPDSRTLHTSVKKISAHPNRYSSTLMWLPRGSDLGLVLCRATNDFGEQKRPCTYTVAPGGPPGPPDCVVLRSYSSALRVQCKKGWDGGRPQTIHLELFNMDGTLIHNVSDFAGHFHLPEIEEGRNVSAVVYASSVRGRSVERNMHLQALKPLIAAVVEETPSRSWTRWLKAAGGILGVAVAAVATALCFRVLRAKRDDSELNPDLVTKSDGSFHREPDFTREERVLGTTNITVNQLASCQNQYSSSPVPSCRVLVGGCARASAQKARPATPHSYYV